MCREVYPFIYDLDCLNHGLHNAAKQSFKDSQWVTFIEDFIGTIARDMNKSPALRKAFGKAQHDKKVLEEMNVEFELISRQRNSFEQLYPLLLKNVSKSSCTKKLQGAILGLGGTNQLKLVWMLRSEGLNT